MSLAVIKKRAAFLAAASSGYKWVRPAFVIQLHSHDHRQHPQIGYTVTKKQGNAVERNRMKRRLREAVRLALEPHLRPGYDYVLIARRPLLEMPFSKLMLELTESIGRLHRVYDQKQK